MVESSIAASPYAVTSQAVNPAANAMAAGVAVCLPSLYFQRVATVGDRVRQILELRNVSARELSRRAGLGETQVALLVKRYERNPDVTTSLATLTAIASGGGVSLKWLATGQGDPTDEDPKPLGGSPVDLPRFGSLDNWPTLRATAKAVDDRLEDWALDELESARPILRGPITPAVVADLARVIMRHSQR